MFQFDMIGRLVMPRETEKFHPYRESVSSKGWKNKRLNIDCICGVNRHLLTVSGGAWADEHGEIYTFAKAVDDGSGKRGKGESLRVPYNKRFDAKILEQIAEFRKFIIDLEAPGRRQKLLDMFTGNVTDEELNSIGLKSASEIEDAIKASEALRFEFISEMDFIDKLKEIVESGKYERKMFRVRGTAEYSYNEDTQTVYQNYVPNRIYLADDDAEPYSTGTFELLFCKDSVLPVAEDDDKYFINGWTMNYVNSSVRKGNIPCPTVLVIPIGDTEAEKKKSKKILSKFEVTDDGIYQYGVTVDMLNGAQREQIKLEDLDPDVQEEIELGVYTLADYIKDSGGSVFGERVREYRFVKPSRGYVRDGVKETGYTRDDMEIKPLETEEDDEDLFKD